MAEASAAQWDLFVCHASEDKDSFVRPLAYTLVRFGVRVWYDDFTLKVGDSISRSIDRGLALSSFGAVVLSPAFLEKAWPEYELRGLTAKEVGSGKVILPIWLGVMHSDVLRYSPPLADKRALHTEGKSITEVAVDLIEEVRPDIFENIHMRLAYRRQLAQARSERTDIRELHPGPIRHETLPEELVGRIRLVRAALLEIYTHSMDFWLEGFRRDAHPSREVAFWEHFAAVILEYCAMTRLTEQDQFETLFGVVMGISHAQSEDVLKAVSSSLPDGALETLRSLWTSPLPPFDIEEDSSIFDEGAEAPQFQTDVERFPSDPPEDLIDELLAQKKDSGDGDE